MPYDVKLPDIGEGIAEGEIVRWMVKVGDAVKDDQPLVEVMTDKATVEIPSPRTGTIAAIHAEAGSVVPVGSVIISIALAGETVSGEAAGGAGAAGAASPAAAGGAHCAPGPEAAESPRNNEGGAVPQAAAPAAPAGRVQATPAVRQMAKQMGVALESIVGTGPGGAISADDVKKAAAGGAGVAAPAGAPGSAAPSRAANAAPAANPDEERVPLRGLRRKIAEAMRRSIETAAHFTFVAECDFTTLAAHRAAARGKAEAAGIKLTYLAYIVKALAPTLREFPLLNARLDDERGEIVLAKRLHLGIATATEEGLTVPVIHDADRHSLFALAREIERLAKGARDHSIRLEELQGGTFTVTSTGARGGVLATPILHHPQVAILGVHEVKKKPAVVHDQIVIRDLGNLSLSLDHRVVDGAVGADFLYALIARLEKPEGWLGEGDLS
jgi:pyruvate dehydrogenase E2 component (dihydrolipoamide acetyltransferase)